MNYRGVRVIPIKLKGGEDMRVKLKDPEKDVEKFEFGKEYGIFFYAMTGYLKFTHTRKNQICLWEIGANGEVCGKKRVSKRELKQTLRDRDIVQWVVALNEEYFIALLNYHFVDVNKMIVLMKGRTNPKI